MINIGRILGIDFGTKRIGLSLSDEKMEMAFPLCVIKNDSESLSAIALILKKNNVSAIVIGESKDFSMKDNPVMEKVRMFVEELSKESGLEVFYEPEFLSSHQAHHFQGKTEMLDASAATIILQSYIDRQKNNLKI